jgi:hypothetical protein
VFGLFALACGLAGLGFGGFVLREFALTGQMLHPSTAVLAAALVGVALLSLATGLILDTVNRRSHELLRLVTDQVLPRSPRTASGADPAAGDTG